MPNLQPPRSYNGKPATTRLVAGTPVYRIHQKRFPVTSFNPVPSHRYYGGGRFDSTDDDHYGFLYVGETPATAVAETLLRDLSIDDTGARQLPRAAYATRQLSALTFTADLPLVDMRTSKDLAQFGQDTWLTFADPRDYAQTRHWGHWIRNEDTSAAGFIWPSRRELGTASYVLFSDRLGSVTATDEPSDPALPPPAQRDFDKFRGRAYLRRTLATYNVTVNR